MNVLFHFETANGVATDAVLSAEVLPQNQHMLHVFGDSGIPVTTHTFPGGVLVELANGAGPAPQCPSPT